MSNYKKPTPEILQKQLNQLINIFWKTKPFISDSTINHELEVRFGTRQAQEIKPLTKIDYDNVISRLKSHGFTCANQEGEYLLRIQTEYIQRSGQVAISPIRVEIAGFHTIQEYCKHNDITKVPHVEFYKKSLVRDTATATTTNPVNFDDFNFRVSYSTEEKMREKEPIIKAMINNWTKSKKIYRYINRVSFIHEDLPVSIDISIVKSSTYNYNSKPAGPIPAYTTDDAKVFQNPEVYEIEIEIDNSKIGPGTGTDVAFTPRTPNQSPPKGREFPHFTPRTPDHPPPKGREFPHFTPRTPDHPPPKKRGVGGTAITNSAELLLEKIKIAIKNVLMGLQETNYPVAYPELRDVLKNYLKLMHSNKENYNFNRPITTTDFIGPNSYTLQMKNIVPINNNLKEPNIRNDYTATDKADGSRCLMYISDTGKIYLINTNMKVMFTGAKTEEKTAHNSLIDGEIILHDKNGAFINLYAAFDVYFIQNKDVRSFGFITRKDTDEPKNFRLPLLKGLIQNLSPVSILKLPTTPIPAPITIVSKEFYSTSDKISIFDACNKIITRENNNEFIYNTDGIIFTPANYGVGTDAIGKPSPNFKTTWDYSFKWKPPKYNTIDFLVTTKKGDNGMDMTTPIFQDGLDTQTTIQFDEYKTIILRCGFDEKKHGYINPCQNVIEDKLPSVAQASDDENKYQPVQFYPTNPYDPNAGICKIMLHKDDTGVYQMMTEENEVFQDNTIVEFRYDLEREPQWRWIPLRVRYDKTGELRQGIKNFGNAYPVANSNWHSIHNPITGAMISTGRNIPDEIANDDVYYNRITKSKTTRPLRDFHNLYVKQLLISSVAKNSDTLIDYACGKGGDFPKWISANLSFVFGIDVSKDNLENRLDGACARFLNYRKQFKTVPYALFVNGNSGSNIRSGKAMLNDKAIQITRAVFGVGTKDEEQLGKGVARQYGKGEDGFNISSCQFAMHYFFENKNVFQNFIRNLSECTKLGGYFIGTCYDGTEIFKLLKNKKQGESIELYDDANVKIWEIKKEYSSETFDDDASSLGKRIDVYQESIDKMFPEYLVNFNYLGRVMQNYGFSLVKREEALDLGLPEGSGLFQELFVSMTNEVKRNKNVKNEYGTAFNMTESEKKISFLNRYFVYKKTRQVIAEKVALEEIEGEEEAEEEAEKEPTIMVEEEIREKSKSKAKAKEKAKAVVKEKIVKPKVVREKPVRKLNRTLRLVGEYEEEEEPVIELEREPQLEEVFIPLPEEEPVLKVKKIRVRKLKK